MKTQTTKTENLHVFVPHFVRGSQPHYAVVALFGWTLSEKLSFATEQLHRVNPVSNTTH